jgi:hypothetical protein
MRIFPSIRRKQKSPAMRREDNVLRTPPENPPSEEIMAKALLLNISISYSEISRNWYLADSGGRTIAFYRVPIGLTVRDSDMVGGNPAWDEAVNNVYQKIRNAQEKVDSYAQRYRAK